jgi:hypothetical protein
MKLNDLAIIIILFIIVSFILSLFNLISFSFTDILAYSLLVIGIALVYTETIRQHKISVFIGTVIFLCGVYFLITENFNININESFYLPIILIFGGFGFLILYLLTAVKKLFLFGSLLLIMTGTTILLLNSPLRPNTFYAALFPVLKFLWPVIVIILVLIFLMRTK